MNRRYGEHGAGGRDARFVDISTAFIDVQRKCKERRTVLIFALRMVPELYLLADPR